MLTLGHQKEQEAKFSITLQVRDKKGRPTGKVKSFHTDSAEQLSNFYERNQPRRKNKVNPKLLPKKDEAEKILTETAQYAEKVQEKKQQSTTK